MFTRVSIKSCKADGWHNAKFETWKSSRSVSGISRPTLSKYFNDPDSVRQSTRKRIEKALDQHDYRPNVYAMNQNRRTTRNIGIVVPYLADPFFTEIGRAVEMACIDAGYSPILLSSHGNPDHEKENLESLRSLKPAGVLLAPFGRASDRKIIQKFSQDVPLVLFDANISDTGEAFIGTDNFQSVGLIVEYLCRSGEPPCFFEMKTPSNPNAIKRRQAYQESMAAAWPSGAHLPGRGRRLEFRGDRQHRGRRECWPARCFPDQYRSVQQRSACHRHAVGSVRPGNSGWARQRLQPAYCRA